MRAFQLLGLGILSLTITQNQSRLSNNYLQCIEYLAPITSIYPVNNFSLGVNIDDVYLTWDAPTDVTGLIRYNLYRDGTGVGNTQQLSFVEYDLPNGHHTYTGTASYNVSGTTANVTVPSYDDLGLANGMYDYSVTAVYGAGESGSTTPVTATIEIPYAPETAEADVQPDTHNGLVNWTAPVDSGLLIGYNVYRLIDGEQGNQTVWTEVTNETTETSYVDEDFATLPVGNYLYSIMAVYQSGAISDGIFTNVIDPTNDNDDVVTSVVTSLNGNYPNPFNPTTTISFSQAKSSHVDILVFNNRGQIVKKVVNNDLQAGNHTVVWNGLDRNGVSDPSGIYFIRMMSDTYHKTVKAVLMK